MKPWYQSKTIWLNIAATAATLGDALTGAGILGPQAAAAVAIGNVLLRAVTTTPIGSK